METYLVWRGVNNSSIEHCHVSSPGDGHLVKGVVVGMEGDKPFTCEYIIRTNAAWETTFASIHSRVDETCFSLNIEGDGKGNWTSEDVDRGLYKGCIDIDISLTPFTNSLPINRLAFGLGEQHSIFVLYVDVLEQRIRITQQQYTRMANQEFLFESQTDDFRCPVYVDEEGFVTDYPGLFTRQNKTLR